MKYLIGLILGIIWLYVLHVLKKSKLNFWHFAVGSAGLFIFMMVYLRPVLTQPLARIIAAIAGIPGNLFHLYTAYFKYGIIFVQSKQGAISLMIDFECSESLKSWHFFHCFCFTMCIQEWKKSLSGCPESVHLWLQMQSGLQLSASSFTLRVCQHIMWRMHLSDELFFMHFLLPCISMFLQNHRLSSKG